MNYSSLEFVLGFTQALALTMSVAFLTYVCLIVVPYLRHKPVKSGDATAFEWHFLIPCRDEEAVISDTVRYLRGTFPRAHLWIIDDDSDDRTAGLVRRLRGRGPGRDEFVHLIQRRRPRARTGKGDALNAGYRSLRRWLGARNGRGGALDPDRIVVVVVDADGRPSPNCLDVCAAEHLFGNPEIGAVQVDVWMSNRNDPPRDARRSWSLGSTLVRMQDLEFRAAIAAIQMSRKHTGTISMGGNGQLTRLSALDSVAGRDKSPWRGSLLEDFELGVHLLTAGWRTGFTVDAHVQQEGLYSVRRFLAQRTRWGQGTMQCARYVRRIWSSRYITTLGAAEMLYYLAQPWMQLIGTIVYPIPFVLLGTRMMRQPEQVWNWITDGAWILFTVYGSFGLLPFIIWGPIYWARCERKGGWLRGVGYGLTYAVYIYSFYITSWRALARLVLGRNGWAKTRRNTERGNLDLVAAET
jgi:cellulose synthase/poly-beta-1,6-N-acetylglucosamine synthase-like glycosyltransferase